MSVTFLLIGLYIAGLLFAAGSMALDSRAGTRENVVPAFTGFGVAFVAALALMFTWL